MADAPAGRGRTKAVWTFYYDGDCGFCCLAVKWLGRLDFFKAVRWMPCQSLDEPPPGLTREDLEAAAYLDRGQGGLEEGFYAFRWLTIRILPLVLLAPLFWLPGIALLGVPAYQWVARHRHRISRCGLPTVASDQAQGPPAADR